MDITITIWVKNSDLISFLKYFHLLNEGSVHYRTNPFYPAEHLPICYTKDMMGDFVQLNIPIEQYLFWEMKTKLEK